MGEPIIETLDRGALVHRIKIVSELGPARKIVRGLAIIDDSIDFPQDLLIYLVSFRILRRRERMRGRGLGLRLRGSRARAAPKARDQRIQCTGQLVQGSVTSAEPATQP